MGILRLIIVCASFLAASLMSALSPAHAQRLSRNFCGFRTTPVGRLRSTVNPQCRIHLGAGVLGVEC